MRYHARPSSHRRRFCHRPPAGSTEDGRLHLHARGDEGRQGAGGPARAGGHPPQVPLDRRGRAPLQDDARLSRAGREGHAPVHLRHQLPRLRGQRGRGPAQRGLARALPELDTHPRRHRGRLRDEARCPLAPQEVRLDPRPQHGGRAAREDVAGPAEEPRDPRREEDARHHGRVRPDDQRDHGGAADGAGLGRGPELEALPGRLLPNVHEEDLLVHRDQPDASGGDSCRCGLGDAESPHRRRDQAGRRVPRSTTTC